MRKQQKEQKERLLVLNKMTVASLDRVELKRVRGGGESAMETRCCTFNCN